MAEWDPTTRYATFVDSEGNPFGIFAALVADQHHGAEPGSRGGDSTSPTSMPAKAFVTAVLGWEPTTVEGYDRSWWFVPRPGQVVGLIAAVDDVSVEALDHHRASTLGSLLYFDVDDLEATLAAVKPASKYVAGSSSRSATRPTAGPPSSTSPAAPASASSPTTPRPPDGLRCVQLCHLDRQECTSLGWSPGVGLRLVRSCPLWRPRAHKPQSAGRLGVGSEPLGAGDRALGRGQVAAAELDGVDDERGDLVERDACLPSHGERPRCL